MKKITLTLTLLLGFMLTLPAQEKRWEHSFNLAVGQLIDGSTLNYNTGISTKLGYGIAYGFSEQWSLKSGVSVRADLESPVKAFTYDGGDYDGFTFVEVPLVARYHTANNLVLGFGPVFSFCTANGSYYINSDPRHPLNGMAKIKDFYVGLQPSIAHEWKHLSIGVEATLGLMDVKLNHGLTTGSKYLHQVMGCVAYKF